MCIDFSVHVMYNRHRKGLWVQHVHDSVQTFFFGKGSFASSFPVLSLGSLAYLRQLTALHSVPITFKKNVHAWIKDGENGILLWTTPGKLYYMQRQHTDTSSVVLFEHNTAPEHRQTQVFGRLGALLPHMHSFSPGEHNEELERLLFIWLCPEASFTKEILMETSKLSSLSIMKKQTEVNGDKWCPELFFVRINEKNRTNATLQLKTEGLKEATSPNSLLDSKEWSPKGKLQLHCHAK